VAAPCPAPQARRLWPGRRGSRACPQHRNGAPKDRIQSSGGSRPPGNRPEPLPSAGGHPLGVPIPSIKLDVDGTTSVEWTVQKQVGGQWVTVQTGTNGTTGDPYTISLNNPMTEAVHRVIGTTSGASGPYKATATPL